MKGYWVGVAVLLMVGITFLVVGAFREEAAAVDRENAQGIELAVQKVEIADLKRRVRELEEDMDRVAPHTIPRAGDNK